MPQGLNPGHVDVQCPNHWTTKVVYVLEMDIKINYINNQRKVNLQDYLGSGKTFISIFYSIDENYQSSELISKTLVSL